VGHRLFGLIASTEVLAGGGVGLVALPRGLSLLPLTDRAIETIGATEPFAEKELPPLTVGVAWLAAELSRKGPVAAISTEYFGGDGEQGAIVWNDGAVRLGPLVDTNFSTSSEEWPINRALALLGVVATDEADAFDVLELWRFRSTERAAGED
jgi:hypothetical protein